MTAGPSIDGRVVDAAVDDHGVEGATVRVEGAQLADLSDEHGRFAIDDAPPGPVVLVVEAPSYTTERVRIGPEQRGEPIEVQLSWAGSEYVARTAASPGPPPAASTTVLRPRQLSAAPRRNAEELLRQVPGLTLVQHGSEGKGHQFFLRGFDAMHGADLEVTVDGVPLNEWSNVHAQGYLDLSVLMPEFVDRVTVTKGPFDLEQAAFAMAGTAAYRLGVPADDRGWRTAYTIGTTNRHRLFAGWSPPQPKARSFIGAEATHDDGFGQRRQLDRATFNGRWPIFELDAHTSVDLLGLATYSQFELPGLIRHDDVAAGRVGLYDAYEPLAKGTGGRAIVALGLERHRGGHSTKLVMYGGARQLELRENFTGFLADPDHGDLHEQRQETISGGLSAGHEAPLHQRLSLNSYLGVHLDRFDQRELQLGRSLQTLSTRRHLSGTQFLAHLRSGLHWRPVDSLRLAAGARADVAGVDVDDHLDELSSGSGTLAAISPRATLQWRQHDDLRWFAAYGRGFRPPMARAFSSDAAPRHGIPKNIAAETDPAMTTSDALEVGARWNPSLVFGLTLSAFATFIERESIFDHVSNRSIELDGTRRLGAELVAYSDPLAWLSLSADLTVVDARFVTAGNRVPQAPWLTSGIRATATHQTGWRGGLRLLGLAPRALPHGASGATLVSVDATAGWHWQWLRVDLEIKNLLDRSIREGEYNFASHWRPDEPASRLPTLHSSAGAPLNARLTIGANF